MKVGIVGATGLVGEKLIEILHQRDFPVDELRLFASQESQGTKIIFKETEYEVQELSEEGFSKLDLVFFAVNNELAAQWVPVAQKECLVIDKSSVFRLKADVPLIVPEVNSHLARSHKNLIASPNCTTIPVVMALNPLKKKFGLKKVWVVTFQAVSGAGQKALEEFLYETEVLAYGEKIIKDESSFFSHPIAGNIIPQIGAFEDDGYTEEEKKLISETRKILGLNDLPISATCVRVPVAIGHFCVVSVEFVNNPSLSEIASELEKAPGLKVMKDNEYPTPLLVQGRDEVFLARLRTDYALECGITFLVATDNLRKGAALNAVQIAEAVFNVRPKGMDK
jgi:aspartate-semialdehyde dehydrogenase